MNEAEIMCGANERAMYKNENDNNNSNSTLASNSRTNKTVIFFPHRSLFLFWIAISFLWLSKNLNRDKFILTGENYFDLFACITIDMVMRVCVCGYGNNADNKGKNQIKVLSLELRTKIDVWKTRDPENQQSNI